MYSVDGKKKGKVKLPSQFNEPIREDLIRRGFLALMSHKRQKYGSDPKAGKRQGKAFPKRRRKYGTTYGYGISRVKRKVLSARGSRFYRVGAFISGAVSGRKAHSPTSEKKVEENINKKERRKALRSAISATRFDDFPIVTENKVEGLQKTKEVKKLIDSLELGEEADKEGKRILFVVSEPCELMKGANNLPGVEVTTVRNLSVENLAPGGNPGRITVWSREAIEKMNKENMFM